MSPVIGGSCANGAGSSDEEPLAVCVDSNVLDHESDATVRCFPFSSQVASQAVSDDENLPQTPIFPAIESGSTATQKPYEPNLPVGYHFISHLGSGGSGDVYLVEEFATERTLAMKFLHSTRNPELIDRFLIEIRALSRLTHPHIVAIQSAEFHRAGPYFTMEYVAGGSLAQWMAKHPITLPLEAAQCMLMIAQAVQAAHKKGIIHRDLKPANVLLAPIAERHNSRTWDDDDQLNLADMIPKISDFGLAKRTDREDGVTIPGVAMGTPGYMAPEQVIYRDGEVGIAVDIHGIGAILYHLIVGKAPYPWKNEPEVFKRILTEMPARPRSIVPAIPLALEAIVMKCLAKNPRDRYPSATSLADDLKKFIEEGNSTAPHMTAGRLAIHAVSRQWKKLIASAAVLLIACGLFALGAASSPGNTPIELEAPADSILRDLVAGKSVTLIGENGMPRYQRSVLSPITLGPSPLGDQTCSLQSVGLSLLELLPDPGIDRYRIELDLRQFSVDKDRRQDPKIGFYFGYQEQLSAQKKPFRLMHAVRFFDFSNLPTGRTTRQNCEFGFSLLRMDPIRGTHVMNSTSESVLFDPTPEMQPGRWRHIVAEITPEGLTIQWVDDPHKPIEFVHWSAARMKQEYRKIDAKLLSDLSDDEVSFVDWQPRMPLGIYAFQSALSVRNVSITPLPTPSP